MYKRKSFNFKGLTRKLLLATQAYTLLCIIVLVLSTRRTSTKISYNHRRLFGNESSEKTCRNDYYARNTSEVGDRFNRAQLTRRIKEEINHLWMAVEYEVRKLTNAANITEKAEMALERLRDRKRALTIDIEDLQSYDDVWKNQLAAKSSSHLTAWIHRLQNPPNCKNVSKSYWKDLVECGLGCVMHQLVMAMDHTMETGKVLLANFANSQYTKNDNLDNFPFLQVSSCNNPTNVDNWEEYVCQFTYCGPKGITNRKSNGKLSYIEEPMMTKGYAFKPAAISDEIWLEIKSFHGNPRAWVSGHILSYLMRPKPWMQTILDRVEKKIDFSIPIVGVHVRRNDKLEALDEFATFIDFSIFMIHVKEWYDKYELRLEKEGKSNVVQRRIYLATDDPGVWDEAQRDFPEYNFLGSKRFSIDASIEKTRETTGGLIGAVIDITMLSKCDFLVCTFSSELVTVAYELMQVQNWKASGNYVSLDHLYGGSLAIPAVFHQAILTHKGNSHTKELNLEIGDVLFTQATNFSGYFDGTNNRTGERGWYPSYKVKDATQFYSKMEKRIWELTHGVEEMIDDDGNDWKMYIPFD